MSYEAALSKSSKSSSQNNWFCIIQLMFEEEREGPGESFFLNFSIIILQGFLCLTFFYDVNFHYLNAFSSTNLSHIYFFVKLIQLMTSSQLEPPTLLKRGQELPKIESLGGVQNFLLERGDKSEKEGRFFNNFQFSSITFTVCGGKVRFHLLCFGSSVF